MSFLYPWVFWFSSLIAIPIIIHLFYFRRYKVVLFSNNAMLDNVIKQSKSQQRIRNLIILFLRILFILSLVFAFAQPFIAKNESSDTNFEKVWALYIDNSFSMSQEGEKMSLLDESKSKAIAMLQSLPPTTRYLICYHGMNISASRFYTSEEAQQKINEIKPSSVVLTWNDVFDIFERAKTSLSLSSSFEYAFFTDGQKYAVDYKKWEKRNVKLMLFLAKGASLSNLSIDSIWVEQPNHVMGKNEKITANIHNFGKDDLNNIPVQLFINDTLKSVASLNIKSERSENVVFNFTNLRAGWISGKIEISDFPVVFDNKYYFTYSVYKKINVAVLGKENIEHFKAFFDADSSIQASYFLNDNFAFNSINLYQVVVVNQLKAISSGMWNSLKTFVSKGGTVLIIPNNDWDIAAINPFLKDLGCVYAKSDTIKLDMQIPSMEQDFFSEMFTKKEERAKMPWARNTFIPEAYSSRFDVLLQFENKKNAAIRIFKDKGQWYVLGFSLNPKNSSFLSHPLFVAMIHRIIQLAVPNSSLYYTISQNTTIHIPTDSAVSEKGLQFFNPKTKQSFIPIQQNLFSECIISLKEAQIEDGFYDVISDNTRLAGVALNYNRKESEMNFYNEDELIQLLNEKGIKTTIISTSNTDEIKATVQYQKKGLVLWKWFVLGALFFLLTEMAVIRFWKV